MASESVGLEAMFFVDGEKAQAVLSFGPSASLHPPTPDGAVPPAYGRGWPGSSGQHRLRPCISTLSFTPPRSKAARTASRLRPRMARVLRTTPLTTMHIHYFLHTTPLQGCSYRLPLTAAGGKGPQGNTAYDHAYPLFPSHHPAPRLHVPPPAYGRGWPEGLKGGRQ